MQDEEYLQKAIDLGEQSPDATGCGVIIVRSDEVLAATYNLRRADDLEFYPAEIKAIVEVNKPGLGDLENGVAYCSCEPCDMCYAALSDAQVPRIVGASSL